MKSRRAFSVIETLVVITIVLLVAALVFPVIARAKWAGHKAGAVSSMRQVGIAMQLYLDANDGKLVFRHLDALAEAGFLQDRRILISGSDTFAQGYGRAMSECTDGLSPTVLSTSFEDALPSKAFYDRLKRIDPTAAILADRTHGRVSDRTHSGCDRLHYQYSGTMLRLYEDTHIETAQFSLDMPGSPVNARRFWSRFRLFTDVEPKTF